MAKLARLFFKMVASWSTVLMKNVEREPGPPAFVNRGIAGRSMSTLPRPRSIRICIPAGTNMDVRDFNAAVSQVCKVKPITICRTNFNDVVLTFKTEAESKRLLKVPVLKLDDNGPEFYFFILKNR